MSKPTLKGQLAIEIDKKFPTHGTRTLAKILFDENPLLFRNFDDARAILQYHRGESGEKVRSKSIHYQQREKVQKITNIPKLPESYGNNERLVYKLPIGDNNVLMISDIHLPYHSVEALESALKYGKENKVNTIFINGDLLDFHNESRFEKDPRKRSTKDEFDACQQFFEYLRYEFPKARIYWLKGNHDKRYEHWLMTKAPQLFNDSYYKLEERLQLNKYGVTLIDDTYLVKIGSYL
jgi:predicted phosphodiesterase